jgi:hypothetical protein
VRQAGAGDSGQDSGSLDSEATLKAAPPRNWVQSSENPLFPHRWTDKPAIAKTRTQFKTRRMSFTLTFYLIGNRNEAVESFSRPGKV